MPFTSRRMLTAWLVAGCIALPRSGYPLPGDFASDAVVVVEFQVRANTMAASMSTNKVVKEYAETVLPDFVLARDRLRKAALTGASDKPHVELSPRFSDLLDKLKSTPLSRFDHHFVEMQIATFRDLLAMFSNYSDRVEDIELRRFAAAFLTTLKDHQAKLDKLSKSIPSSA